MDQTTRPNATSGDTRAPLTPEPGALLYEARIDLEEAGHLTLRIGYHEPPAPLSRGALRSGELTATGRDALAVVQGEADRVLAAHGFRRLCDWEAIATAPRDVLRAVCTGPPPSPEVKRLLGEVGAADLWPEC